MVDQLREFEEVRRGWLGVRIQQVSDEIAESLSIKPARGALVAGIDEKGPAKPAGIEPGDVIIKFDGKDVKEMRDLPHDRRGYAGGQGCRGGCHPQAARKKKTCHSLAGWRTTKQAALNTKKDAVPDVKPVVKKALGLDLSEPH